MPNGTLYQPRLKAMNDSWVIWNDDDVDSDVIIEFDLDSNLDTTQMEAAEAQPQHVSGSGDMCVDSTACGAEFCDHLEPTELALEHVTVTVQLGDTDTASDTRLPELEAECAGSATEPYGDGTDLFSEFSDSDSVKNNDASLHNPRLEDSGLPVSFLGAGDADAGAGPPPVVPSDSSESTSESEAETVDSSGPSEVYSIHSSCAAPESEEIPSTRTNIAVTSLNSTCCHCMRIGFCSKCLREIRMHRP